MLDQMEQTKACKKCGTVKALSEYHLEKRSSDGRKGWCRECASTYNKAYHSRRLATCEVYRSKQRGYQVKRKRLLDGAKQEFYLRGDIFARDNWTCQLCEEAIDPDLKWPEARSASIDHILPVSLGGDDTAANVQAAHLRCNTSKNNRV